MEITDVNYSKDKNQVSFVIKGTAPNYVNTIRRLIINNVPTMAIHEVELRKNSSSLYDEVIGHRLGLVPLKTDLESYEVPKSPEDLEKAQCHVKLTLKAKGPCIVYASDLKSKDPKIVPVYPKMVIVKLLDGQELEFEATAVLGYGKDHIKWSPGIAWYTFEPLIKVNNASKNFAEFKNKYPPQAFDKSGKLDKQLIIENNVVDACTSVCDDVVAVEYNKDNFLFHIESFGQLNCKEILTAAIESYNKMADELNNTIKGLEK